MPEQINQAGIFRGQIVEYGLYEAESGSIAVNVTLRIDEVWDSEQSQWADWRQYDLQASGSIWVVKKDKTINAQAAESLVKFAGWDADLAAVEEGRWQPTPCQFSVDGEEYKGEKRYRVAFINDYNRTPNQMGNCGVDKAKKLQGLYGSQLRALLGNATRNAAPSANGKQTPPAAPQSPKKAPAKPSSGKPTPPAPQSQDGGDIPF